MAEQFDVAKMLERIDPAEKTRLESDEFKAEAGKHFDAADVSKTGDLAEAEMAEAVKLALPEERRRVMDLTPENVKDCMMNFDENKNGKIEKDEFVKFITWCVAKEVADYFAQAGNTAKAAAASIKKASIQELKSLPKAPAGVDVVVGSVCFLLGLVDKPDVEWAKCMKALADKDFLKKLAEPGDIPAEKKTQVKGLLEKDEMQKDAIKKKSMAAVALLDWLTCTCG